jgi:hypothetical protein
MENRVYYGQYSLKHWIELILSNNIVLPPYQRLFVWEEKDVSDLISNLKKKQFVPPVTIGVNYLNNDQSQNLILDGQQRLTSILLAYMGIFPDKEYYKTKNESTLANDNDNNDFDEQDNILEWTFNNLIKLGSSKIDIENNPKFVNYKRSILVHDISFFENTYLGFSFLVPVKKSKILQQEYYSSVFRNINNLGKELHPHESRQALYFLRDDLPDFFLPKFIKAFKLNNTSKITANADFVRYLSLLSEYLKSQNFGSLARGYKTKMEDYYKDYIDAVVADNDSSIFIKFTNIFTNRKYQHLFESLKSNIENLEIPKTYISIIDMDTFLFGLIYCILFKKSNFNPSFEKDVLKQELSLKIKQYKDTPLHIKNPNNQLFLRRRIEDSIAIYNKYFII